MSTNEERDAVRLSGAERRLQGLDGVLGLCYVRRGLRLYTGLPH